MKRCSFLLLCVLLIHISISVFTFNNPTFTSAALTLRVGIYDNMPKIFTDEQGEATGFWPDIISYIASEEGWNIEYVKGTWDECMAWLQNGQIDIMPDVALSEERSGLYDFSQEVVYVSWSMLYARKGVSIQSVLDLEGKKIAVLKGSINVEGPEGIKNLVNAFHVNCTFIETDSYEKVMEMVAAGEADLGVTSKDFGYRHEAKYDVTRTPFIFQPASLYFAFTKGTSLTRYLIERIDYHVKELRSDNNSIYYKSLKKWMGVVPGERNVIPAWIKWVLITFAGLAVILAGGSLILRAQIKARTRELRQEIIEHKQAEESLQRTNRALRTLSQSNQALVHSTDELQLLNKVCRVIVEEGGYLLAWAGLVEQDDNKTLRPVAHKGYEEGFLETFHITLAGDEGGQGPIATAICTNKPVAIQDIHNNPGYIPWREESEKRGYASLLAIPLTVNNRPFGVLSIYAAEHDAFDHKETELLHEMANNLAYGITSLRNRAERQRAEENLRTYLEMAPDGIFISDKNGIFLYVNKRAEEICGYSKEELLGKSFLELDILSRQDIESIQMEMGVVNAAAVIEQRDYQLKKKDGTRIYAGITSTPVILAGEYTVLGIVRDITERKKGEEERKRIEEKAQIASRLAAIGEMAAGIAHEINNPLTGVIGFSAMLKDEPNIPQEVRENIDIIHSGCQRVAEIVKRLLTFARQTKPVRTPVNINELIENTLKLREYVLRTANIELLTYYDPQLPWSMADPGQLQQVFMNLIVNAEQAIKESGHKGMITIATEKRDNCIRISVQDNGTGISEENKTRIFEPFFTTKKQGEGTGLGLSLSRSIIVTHGGEIKVESEYGHGATFIVELPVVEIPVYEEPENTSTTKSEPGEKRIGNILVIDDEAGVREFIDRALTRAGYRVDAVPNAQEALEKINSSETYDIIFLDFRMPGMNGIELYQYILEKKPALARKIIFLTGDIMGADISAFLKKYSVPYLVKPFVTEQLKEKVNDILKT